MVGPSVNVAVWGPGIWGPQATALVAFSQGQSWARVLLSSSDPLPQIHGTPLWDPHNDNSNLLSWISTTFMVDFQISLHSEFSIRRNLTSKEVKFEDIPWNWSRFTMNESTLTLCWSIVLWDRVRMRWNLKYPMKVVEIHDERFELSFCGSHSAVPYFWDSPRGNVDPDSLLSFIFCYT